MDYYAGKMLGLNKEEASVYEWQYHLTGDFGMALFGVIMLADFQHLAKLEQGFPDEVHGFLKYRNNTGWWKDVQKKAEDSKKNQ